MTRRARQRQEGPLLGIQPGGHTAALPQPEHPLTMERLRAAADQPVTALFLGLHRDGRHVAAELQVSGREVVGGAVLCASRYAHEASRAWSACATARFFHRREYTEAELKANARQGAGVALADIAHGEAVSIARVGTKSVATRLSLEGLKVVELKVLAEGDALYAWSEAHSWAQRHLLPRESR